MALGYFSTLLIAKPRDISFLDKTIEKSLKAIHPNITLMTDVLFLDWNRDNLALELKASHIRIKHENGFSLYLPELTIDINRAGLLFGKIIISNIKAHHAVADLSTLKETSNAEEETKKMKHFSLPDSIINFQKFIHNVALEHFTIKLKKQRQINSTLKISSHQSNKTVFTTTQLNARNENREFFLEHNCQTDISSKNVNCSGKSNILDSEFLHSLKVPHINKDTKVESLITYKIDADQSDKLGHINFTLVTTNKGTLRIDKITNQIPFTELKINGEINEDVKLDFFANINEQAQINGAFTASEDAQENKHFILSLQSNKIRSDYLDMLWPIPVAETLRNYLIENTEAKVDEFDFLLALDKLPNQKKLQLADINLNIKFKDGKIAYSNLFPEIKNINGKIELNKNALDIKVEHAKAHDISLGEVEVKIPYPLRTHKKLFISSKFIGHPNSHLFYLLSKTISKEKLDNLKNTLSLDGKIIGNLKINLPISPSLSLEDVFINANLQVQDFRFLNYLTKSQVIFELKKSIGSEEFQTNMQCVSCNLDIANLNYLRKETNDHKISTDWLLIPNGISFKTMSMYVKGIQKLHASGSITEKGFNNFQVKIRDVGANNFDLTVNQDGDNFFYNIAGKSLDLGRIFDIIGQNNSSGNTIVNGSLDKVIMPLRISLNNAYFASKYISDGTLISLINANFNGEQNFINLTRSQGKDNERIVIESDNLGDLANYLTLTDRILAGNIHLELNRKTGNSDYIGKLYVNNFAIKEIPFLSMIKKLDVFKALRKELSTNNSLPFDRAKADFILSDNIKINHAVAHGKPLGITSSGHIYLADNKINLNGVIIPAYQLNRLFGIADIPFFGKLITGGKDAGIISPRYKVTGTLNDNKFEINPLSAATPGFLRNIFDFSLTSTIEKTEKCLKSTPKNLMDKDLKSISKDCL